MTKNINSRGHEASGFFVLLEIDIYNELKSKTRVTDGHYIVPHVVFCTMGLSLKAVGFEFCCTSYIQIQEKQPF